LQEGRNALGKTAVHRSGLAAVAATISILFMSLSSLYLVAYLNLSNRAAALAAQEASVGQAPRVPEVLSAYIYNASLCALLEGKLSQEKMPWKLLVVNTGNILAEVDSIVLAVDRNIVYSNSSKQRLLPGQYIALPLEDCGAFCAPYMTLGVVQVHTSRGGFFTGGYGIPRPEAVVNINEQGRCVEP